MPTIAVLSSAPDNMAETGAGPSLWASGSQVCIGARPTLVPKPIRTRRNDKGHKGGVQMRRRFALSASQVIS